MQFAGPGSGHHAVEIPTGLMREIRLVLGRHDRQRDRRQLAAQAVVRPYFVEA
jgi:hypothetical protein